MGFYRKNAFFITNVDLPSNDLYVVIQCRSNASSNQRGSIAEALIQDSNELDAWKYSTSF